MSIRLRPVGARKKSLAQSKAHSSPSLAETTEDSAKHGYIRSFDGTKLFYSVEGKGKPLIFCYGLICSSLHWTYQIEHFRKGYKTIWSDYRGHQNSELPSNLNSLTPATLAKDLAILLDELGVKDAVFLGHSMGVNVVLEFYRQHPDRVCGMVLANGTAQRPLENIFHTNALEAGMALLKSLYGKSPKLVNLFWKSQKGNPLMRSFLGLAGFNPHLTAEEDIHLYYDQIAEMDPAVLIHLIEGYQMSDSTSWLHTIKTPTLIIAGDEDKVIPIRQQELMHQLIPGSRLEVIHHGSHCCQMDLPELVSMKIEKFLGEINYGLKSTQSKGNANPPSP